MSKRPFLPACAVVLLVTGCSKTEEAATPAAETKTAEAKPAETKPADAQPTDAKATDAQPATATPPAVSGEPVDTCAMLSKADAEAMLGTLSAEPTADTPQGSLLGGCKYFGKKAYAAISARPASEYEDTVKFSTDEKQPGKQVAGLGTAASTTKYGLMIKLEGKPYFLTVSAGSMGKTDDALAETVARKLKL